MPLEATFRNLTDCLHNVNDVMKSLHVTMEEPEHGEAAVVDDLRDITLELTGKVHGAQRAAETALRSLGEPANMDHARRSLVGCQERFHRIEQSFASDVTSYKTISELARVSGRSKQWAAWANSATQAIDDCRQPLDQASEALAACWQELAERLGMTNISMQATNVGQQITLSRDKDRDKDRDQDLEVEGVT